MNHSAISVRYARALLEAATEAGLARQVLEDVMSLERYFTEIPAFTDFIESPVIPATEKAALFASISQDFQDLTLRFFRLITEKRRESHIRMMVKNFIRFYRKEAGIMEATLITATEVSDETARQISQDLEKTYQTRVELQKQTDDRLIGGFVLRIDDQQLDASMAEQLRKVREGLEQTLMQKQEG